MTDTVPSQRYELDDRYRREEGRVFMSGVQALARLPLDQLRADRPAGLDTAAFVSGYQGSPLGGYDREESRRSAARVCATATGSSPSRGSTRSWRRPR